MCARMALRSVGYSTVNVPHVATGILILNFHQPACTMDCVRRLLEVEGPDSRVIWLENDAAVTLPEVMETLRGSGLPWVVVNPDQDDLPPPGVIGLVPIPQNLGYGAGNNVGMRFLHRHAVPFTWVMNNDTMLLKGSSRELQAAARECPEVGIWGLRIVSDCFPPYYGGTIQTRDFSVRLVEDPTRFASDPNSYASGCAMFFRTGLGIELGGIPEHYFLYHEDAAFNLEVRRRGFRIAAVDAVEIFHHESHTSGRRSPLMEFYTRRNRWLLIERYYPHCLFWQKVKLLYRLQKNLFRLRRENRRFSIELAAWKDYRNGCTGMTERKLGT